MTITIELILGVLLAAGGVAVVLRPILQPQGPFSDVNLTGRARTEEDVLEAQAEESPRIRALTALKEIEFDRETGKLDDDDYQTLKAQYTKLAVDAIRQEDDSAADAAPLVLDTMSLDALAEARVAEIQQGLRAQPFVCPICGPRPEADAIFCSTCGKKIAA